MTYRPTAKQVVNRILDHEIAWVDWRAMPDDKRKEWAEAAKAALDNKALQSLIGRSQVLHGVQTNGEVVKRCIEAVARYSKSHEETENIRMTINGMELLKELLEEMLLTEDKATNEEPNAPI